ncbi:hypothetical protein OUZ56_000886 [Daphnia magna]|uniref:Uncharacterized protein n=1 Tax=Daphnia magna TaxID=35525 RepID=A0ABR0A117_9CRUS|nr:hypothetical protein OUZ56_000886 [Daphnia magna]
MEFNNFPAVLTVDRFGRFQTFEDFFPTGVFITSVCGIVLVYTDAAIQQSNSSYTQSETKIDQL